MRTITVEELEKQKKEECLIVDIRSEDAFARGSFPQAINLPQEEFQEHFTQAA